MSKAENGRNGLVFPSKDFSYSEELKQHLQDAGFLRGGSGMASTSL